MTYRQKELNFFANCFSPEGIAVNNKLEKVCDRYVTVLNNTLKPTKPFYQMMVEKHNVHTT
jgi:benzoyl-CoA reductase/2-hydroxyglutaryl-CoA dehydratase subunit BcrC/BadD/HgdB